MHQYGVWPPPAARTASHRCRMFVQYFFICLSSILSHSYLITSISSCLDFGNRCCTWCLSNLHTFLIGFRSGEFAGH
ncbi:hypothetical protein K469DRAFT_52415 [Zopfia rhizophila CBS 207.26]|uniref:Uncharacterized protein n=1 Tax=Zopfia rhizophila CBS 207.26 TaxID=1314779 RepID=A0A6A6D9P3_9PEZI|nr:hypothetical protein K469DRAFT_52415 [Zopfia rhizophila CBS 207.26]